MDGFAQMMNLKATELGLSNTHFISPHGLDNDNHYTTAYELALITDYALNNQTFCNIVGTKNYTVTINGLPRTINNTHELLGNLNGVYGVKTGFTNGANRCLVTACKRNNLDIICIVLGADTKKFRTQDTIKMIEYTYKTYEVVNLAEIINTDFNNWKECNLKSFNVIKGRTNTIDLDLECNYTLYPIKKDYINNITTMAICDFNLNAPIDKNSKIGTFIVKIDENTFLSFNIISTNCIKRNNILTYMLDFFVNFFNYLTISN